MTSFEAARQQDKVVILKRVPLLASCTEAQLHLIADRTRLVEYKKGECVYREGEPAAAFYLLSSGRLRVFSVAGGQEKTFVVLHNGDTFGEISLLTGENHSATVEALNDALVLQLEKKDFDEVINRIPSLVLHLSRVLSKRLRAKEVGGEFSEATIIAVSRAARGVGQSCFTGALAASLKRETGSDVVIVDFSSTAASRGWLFESVAPAPTSQHTLGGVGQGEPFQMTIAAHPLGFSVLLAGQLLAAPGREQAIAPLLSFLTGRFAYILLELPAEANAQVLKALTQADLVYLITDPRRENVIRTGALLHQLQVGVGHVEQRLKLIVNLRERPIGSLSAAEISDYLKLPVAYTLPQINTPSGRMTAADVPGLLDSRLPYALMVRYIARDLGGLLVGLALGSGAALGLAHIGVLKVLERERIPIDIIAGASIGALVGGLWAAGRSAEELEQMALRFKDPWDIRQLFVLDLGIPLISVLIGIGAGVFVGWLAGFWAGLLFGMIVCLGVGLVLGPLVGGPIQGARLMARLESDFAGKTFDDTWLPLKIIAANPVAREEVIFETGSLAEAVRASVSIPGIFKPVIRGGKLCLDGGVISPVPVGVLKRAGAHHVIAVNVFPTTPELIAYREEQRRSRAERDAQLAARSLPWRLFWRLRQEVIRSLSPLVFDVIMRSMQAMEHQIAEVNCREADLTLRPTVPGSHWLEFFHPEPFIRRGEEVALEYLPELRRITRGRHVDKASADRVG